ncbi:hypothetical protein [Spirosoma sp.]|uniref:hypothetical protein n=1 Tax=Spirosoma sp. TaxID=1899569 RepID=UPI00262735AE|nr:hypothetical protein [Spirosoma sp.]MCX6213517.1 hypothetical protein [Spirosoma sp.]
MGHRISRRTAFDKDIKSFKKAKNLIESIKDSINEIINDPTSGESLTGNWKGYKSYHFNRKPEIRIIYAVYPCCILGNSASSIDCLLEIEADEDDKGECLGVIDFVRVASREEFNNIYNLRKKFIPNTLT